MKTLSDVLAIKGKTVYSVRPTDTVHEAMRVMDEKGVGALLVISEKGIAGILSERDVARKITLSGKIAKQTPTAEIMTDRITSVAPDLDIGSAMSIMTEQRIRHLPVVKGDHVLGVVSIGDLVKAIIDDQKFEIDQLHHYITS